MPIGTWAKPADCKPITIIVTGAGSGSAGSGKGGRASSELKIIKEL